MMERYEKYKDSGVEWIGEIPEGWVVKKLKYVAVIANGSTPKSYNPGFWNGDILWATPVDVNNSNGLIVNTLKKITNMGFESCGVTLIEPNSIILTTRAPIGNISITENYLCTNQGCKSIHKINANHKFLYYYIMIFSEYLNALGSGSTFKELSTDNLKDFYVFSPSNSEQATIANYLDRKTAEIDQLIAQKERLLELYEEEKTAIINQAVTQGINPDVKLKDRGIDWLGEIPEHWEIKKMKYLTTILKDGTHGSFTRVLNGYRLLSVRNIKGDSFDFLDDDSKISKIDFLTITKPFKISENDIQLAIVGATLGKVAIVPKLDEEFATQRSVATIRSNPNYMETKFQFYFFKSDFFQNYLWINAGFSAQPGVYLGTLEDCHIPVPSLKEQTTIVQYIETETARINTKITKTKKIITLQKEYRTALISEVVTGKIKVTQEVV